MKLSEDAKLASRELDKARNSWHSAMSLLTVVVADLPEETYAQVQEHFTKLESDYKQALDTFLIHFPNSPPDLCESAPQLAQYHDIHLSLIRATKTGQILDRMLYSSNQAMELLNSTRPSPLTTQSPGMPANYQQTLEQT